MVKHVKSTPTLSSRPDTLTVLSELPAVDGSRFPETTILFEELQQFCLNSLEEEKSSRKWDAKIEISESLRQRVHEHLGSLEIIGLSAEMEEKHELAGKVRAAAKALAGMFDIAKQIRK